MGAMIRQVRDALKADKPIYLASPYSHPDPTVREERYKEACMAAAGMMRAGHLVYSPIVHSHPLTHYGLPTDWGYWKRLDELWVLMLDGWTRSRGVQHEIEIAKYVGITVRYIKISSVAALEKLQAMHSIGCVCVECEELQVLEAMGKGGYR